MITAVLSDFDVYLWSEGTHYRAYEKLGAHLTEENGVAGTHFAVWAPDAREVSVVGDFNGWRHGAHPMHSVRSSGIWECFIPGVGQGGRYKYALMSRVSDYAVEKADPYGFAAEIRPHTASKVWDLSGYEWRDKEWMARRGRAHALDAPMSIYEIHLGSWRRVPEQGNRWLTYREAAVLLAEYLYDMGYTHVEFLPLTEHPLDDSWGYQTVGYYAPTSRFGTPQDLMYLIDTLHQRGIGVILDWVPAHFPRDEHGLGFFDGSHLYEHADPRRGEHPDWGTFIYNYGRREVSNYLIGNALFWLDKYHIDGLRVDAVASMLYLDYSRKEGEWTPNEFGGRENLQAISFLRRLNERIYGEYPDVVTFAEESTSWPQVSRPTHLGGLGFSYKWDMGWMHDTLDFMSHDPVHRKYHFNQLTFRMMYAFSENFVLPLSHDEVVHGKQSLLAKMSGDDWQRFANLRLLFGYMYSQPGKKLLFMGCEFGQGNEWNFNTSLDWHLLESPLHRGLQRWVRDLNTFYRGEPAMHVFDCDPSGFEWIDCCDAEASVLSLMRKGRSPNDSLAFVFNFTPIPRHNYQIGVPHGGFWQEVLNSDAPLYGGSGQGNLGGGEAVPVPCHGRDYMLTITVPPLGLVAFKRRA
ncbi:MAG: 1,4-alpha-glucan branching protein GlgB [Gemmataceae bacterium]